MVDVILLVDKGPLAAGPPVSSWSCMGSNQPNMSRGSVKSEKVLQPSPDGTHLIGMVFAVLRLLDSTAFYRSFLSM